MDIIWKLLLVLLLVGANGFFVAAEFALVKVRTSQIDLLARKGRLPARLAQSILERLDAYLSACQLGITLTSLGLGWAGEPWIARFLESGLRAMQWNIEESTVRVVSFLIAFLTITFLHITLGEQAPKILAIQKAKGTTLAVALPLMVFFQIFRPFIWFLNQASNLMLKAVGVEIVSDSERITTEEELRMILVESAAGGTLSRRERLMMENVLDLENKIARQIMVPRCDVVYLEAGHPIDENLKLVSNSGHTRFPVCDGGLDNIIGMIHSKDLLRSLLADGRINAFAQLTRKLTFLPETLRLDMLLLEFQRNQTHLAMLVDEYGVVSGMVTFENVLEELVGPIQDEFDREIPQIVARGKGRYLVDAHCSLTELVERCNLKLPAVDADSTGGLVVELMGHIPDPGESITVGPYTFAVIEAEPTRVRRVEVTIPPAQPAALPPAPEPAE